ncbi:MAG TPA: metal ABC transporter substrate-binding protein [Burkholderiales bacterium]|nr:metal ABC transporter substrate-binding protein [Burkholderiales bacterium]
MGPAKLLFLAWVLFAASGAAAQERLRLVATTTDLKSLAEAVGGERVAVASIVPPNVDPHEYQPKPQDLHRIRDATLLLRVGVDYDLWVDRLAAQAGRPQLQRGGAGHVDCSFAIALLDIRGSQLGPAGGHVHGSGNPHYWLDPGNAEIITGVILEALARNDPANARYYEGERLKFLGRLSARLREWERKLASAQGKPLVAYHNNWAYYARRFRLNFAGYIEPRPGIPPSPSHLASLLKLMETQQVKLIVRQPHEPSKNADFLAARTGAKVVLLAGSVGAVPQAKDYLSLFDYNAEALANAMR